MNGGALDLLDEEEQQRLASATPPDRGEPALARLYDEPPPDEEDWLYERKLDGMRILAHRDGDEVWLHTRNGKDRTGHLPEVAEALAGSDPDDVVLDGEVVAFAGSRTSFSRLQERIGIAEPAEARASGVAVYYYVFDLLHLGGHDTTRLRLRSRKRLLKAAVGFGDPLRFTSHRVGDGTDLLADACDRGWEGLIAKRAGAPYPDGRSADWRKLKCVAGQELVIGGFTDPQGERIGFGALLVGYHAEGDLVYAGRVGTGFDDDTLRTLHDRLTELERDRSPFADAPEDDGVHWVEPELVAEIGFTEWTHGGRLRHPRFRGLRTDKAPEDVVKEADG